MILAMIMAIENEEERSFVETIYDKYHENMLAICYDVLHNQTDAEDALVDAFENIINSVKRIQAIPQHQLPAYLNTCAKNAAIDIYRRNAKGNELFSSTNFHSDNADNDIQIDIADNTLNLEKIVLDKELVVEVFHIIEELPPSLKTVILYKYYHNYRNREIAEMLHISETAVDTRVHRARKYLEKLLAEKHLCV